MAPRKVPPKVPRQAARMEIFRRMALALGLSPEEAEFYYPGRYEEDLIDRLALIDDVEGCSTRAVHEEVPPQEHNYDAPLPNNRLREYLKHMHEAHEAFMKDQKEEEEHEYDE